MLFLIKNGKNLSNFTFWQTHSADAHVTESAAAASALMCGAKIGNDKIAMAHHDHHDESLVGLDCLAALALRAGKAVGLVTTTRVTHASPASLYAQVHHRSAESKSSDERFQVNSIKVWFKIFLEKTREFCKK